VAAKEAALREAQFEKDERAHDWCTSIFRILDASRATDAAIRDAVEYFLKTRREKRGY
jgi:hypothetical protein